MKTEKCKTCPRVIETSVCINCKEAKRSLDMLAIDFARDLSEFEEDVFELLYANWSQHFIVQEMKEKYGRKRVVLPTLRRVKEAWEYFQLKTRPEA